MVLTVYMRALPGDRAFLPPSLANMMFANLMPASGHQDHTPSPSAGLRIRQSAARVHRIPPRVRDDRDTPLMWDGMAGDMKVIWVGRKQKYFRQGGWTVESRNSPSGQIDGRTFHVLRVKPVAPLPPPATVRRAVSSHFATGIWGSADNRFMASNGAGFPIAYPWA